MEVPSQIGLEVRTVIGYNLPSALMAVDVGMDRHRACARSHAHFSYKIDNEVDSMSLEDSKAYEKHCRDGLFYLLHREEGGRGEVSKNFYVFLIIVKSYFVSLSKYIMNSFELQFTQMLDERDFMADSSVNLAPLKEVHFHKYL